MILYNTGGPAINNTPLSQEIAGQTYSYGQTKSVEKSERYWPTVANYPLVTSASRPGDSEMIPLKMSTIEAQTSAAQAAPEIVEGVVDDIEGDDARVRLHYGNRENIFLFSASELKAVGAGYPGAVFGLSVEPDYSYAIIHLQERENAIRSQAPAPDLSFLEE